MALVIILLLSRKARMAAISQILSVPRKAERSLALLDLHIS